jgi:hypothetical protein
MKIHFIENVVAPQHADNILGLRRDRFIEVPPSGATEGVGDYLLPWMI